MAKKTNKQWEDDYDELEDKFQVWQERAINHEVLNNKLNLMNQKLSSENSDLISENCQLRSSLDFATGKTSGLSEAILLLARELQAKDG